MNMSKKKIIMIIGIVVLAVVVITLLGYKRHKDEENRILGIRQQLFPELRTVSLDNCVLKRFGDAHDGGYLLCENLMRDVRSAYSYGIAGRDKWGCDISTTYNLPVHQYDCFDLRKPVCEKGKFIFHEECVGGKYEISDKRLFDSMQNQIKKNHDEKKHLVVKLDVEASEWDTILAAPEELLNVIDQMSVEFHGVDDEKYIRVLQKLKKTFYLVNVHFNNHSCKDEIQPFPGWAYEVLFVNKRLGKPGKSESALPHSGSLDAPNNPKAKDCQASQ